MKKRAEKIKCHECPTQSDCCQTGAWADLEEAKKIISLGLKGEFFQLEPDSDFPSGFRIGTSYNDNPCTFLDPDGLCSIHKIDYHLKPRSCREFPYENDEVSPLVGDICTLFKMKQDKVKVKRRKK
jgi:Fe-S-cluster containining protein